MGAADSHRLQPDFTFKRVGPPSAGATRRITVQVAPKPRVPKPSGEAADVPTPPEGSAARWFWEAISPEIEGGGPFRIEDAVTHLRTSPGGQALNAPRLQHLQSIAKAHGITILSETVGKQVSPAFVLAVIATESAGRADATSHAGAQGLMQLMPATAERFGVSNSLDPKENIKGGVAYLDWLMKEFGGDPILVLAAYNSGENAVKRAGGVPNYTETRNYVPKVIAAWSVARGLCLTPPQLASDGCVFATAGS